MSIAWNTTTVTAPSLPAIVFGIVVVLIIFGIGIAIARVTHGGWRTVLLIATVMLMSITLGTLVAFIRLPHP